MQFFTTGTDIMQTLIILIGAGLCTWGVVNLIKGYIHNKDFYKSKGMKQFVAGVIIVLVARLLIPQLTNMVVNAIILSAMLVICSVLYFKKRSTQAA